MHHVPYKPELMYSLGYGAGWPSGVPETDGQATPVNRTICKRDGLAPTYEQSCKQTVQ
jgi:hypothetical protein